MPSDRKLVEELTPADLQAHPIWEFVTDVPGASETAVRPFTQLPATDLVGRLVGTMVRLSNGTSRWAILSNISLRNPRSTRHFLCVRSLAGTK